MIDREQIENWDRNDEPRGVNAFLDGLIALAQRENAAHSAETPSPQPDTADDQ